MNHADVEKHLADYLEGDLALDDRAILDAHLDHCEECACEVMEMQQTIRLLRLMPEPETPPMIAANVMRRIRVGESRPGLGSRILGGLGAILEPSFMLPASAIAAAALVVMVAQGPAESGLRGLWPSNTPTVLAASAAPAIPGSADAFAARRTAEGTRAARVIGMVPRNAALPTRVDRTSRSWERAAARSAASSAARRRTGWPIVGPSLAAGSVMARWGLDVDSSDPANSRDRLARGAVVPIRQRSFSDRLSASSVPRALVPEVYVANGTGRVVVASSLATLVRDRFVDGGPQALNISQGLSPRSPGSILSGGGDPRDAWLAQGLEDPVDFARFLAGKSLAEQELWVARLSDRAEARGLLGELVLSLQASGDEQASWLAADFLAQAERPLKDSGAMRASSTR